MKKIINKEFIASVFGVIGSVLFATFIYQLLSSLGVIDLFIILVFNTYFGLGFFGVLLIALASNIENQL